MIEFLFLQQSNLKDVISEVVITEELTENPEKYDTLKRKLSQMARDSTTMANTVSKLVRSFNHVST